MPGKVTNPWMSLLRQGDVQSNIPSDPKVLPMSPE